VSRDGTGGASSARGGSNNSGGTRAETGGSGGTTSNAGAPSIDGGADTGGGTASGGRGAGGATTTGGVNGGGSDGGAPPEETGGTASGGQSSGGKASGGTTSGGSAGAAGKGGTGGSAPQGGSGGSGGKGGSGGTLAQGGSGGSGGKGGSGGTVAQGGSGGACASGGAASLFFDNFECGTQAWTQTAPGAFALAMDGSNTYTRGTLASSLALSSAGSSTWSNVLIEVKVKALSFGDTATTSAAVIYGRYVDASHYIAIAWQGDGSVALRQRNGGGSDAYDRETLLTTGQWYTLGLELKNDQARVFIDGVLNKTSLQNPITSGRVALSTQNATARFDDVRVTALP
jgi:hypothetical protein